MRFANYVSSGAIPVTLLDVRALFQRPADSPKLGTGTAIEAIVRQDDRHPSNAATGGGRPLMLPDASSGSGARVAPPVCERQRGRGGAHDRDRGKPAVRSPTEATAGRPTATSRGRLAHHPGDAVVRPPAARRLSAWRSSSWRRRRRSAGSSPTRSSSASWEEGESDSADVRRPNPISRRSRRSNPNASVIQ